MFSFEIRSLVCHFDSTVSANVSKRKCNSKSGPEDNGYRHQGSPSYFSVTAGQPQDTIHFASRQLLSIPGRQRQAGRQAGRQARRQKQAEKAGRQAGRRAGRQTQAGRRAAGQAGRRAQAVTPFRNFAKA